MSKRRELQSGKAAAPESPGVRLGITTAKGEVAAVLSAIQKGEASAFAALAERYRPQLQVHCYRMLGSADDAEDMVQETFLRAWRGRAGFEGRSLFRTWLYSIATNACLNTLERAPRRVLPQDVASPVTVDTDASEARAEPPWAREIPWLQPYPDDLLEPSAPKETELDSVAVSRETIELAFLAALQHPPPRQRAILMLREVLGWSAKETAEMLETSVQSVNAALQRARSTMQRHQPLARYDVRDGAVGRGARPASPFHGCVGAERRPRADGPFARGRPLGHAACPSVVRRSQRNRAAVRALPAPAPVRIARGRSDDPSDERRRGCEPGHQSPLKSFASRRTSSIESGSGNSTPPFRSWSKLVVNARVSNARMPRQNSLEHSSDKDSDCHAIIVPLDNSFSRRLTR